MLNLSCVICAELFGHSDDVHVTPCGHLFHFLCLGQWLERSKTCPQCRNKCTNKNVFRVYFNLANLDISRVDVGTLQEKLDNADLQLKLKEKELNKADKQIKELKETQKKSIKTINGLEQKLQKNEFIILSYSEQVKLLQTDAKLIENLRKEIKSLKQHIEAMESVSLILSGTMSDAEKLLKNETDPKKLSILVATLKRELRVCESKKTDLRSMLKVVQTDLRKEHESKMLLQLERISLLESENYELNEKVRSLELSIASGDISKAVTSSINKINNCQRSYLSKNESHTSPSIKDKVQQIEESNSPYMNIKSSSIGLMPLIQRNPLLGVSASKTTTKLATLKIAPNKINKGGAVRKATSDTTEKYSIFKKPRLGMTATTLNTSERPSFSKYVSDGFGGCQKANEFKNNSDDEDCSEVVDTVPQRGNNKVDNECANKFSLMVPSLSKRIKSGGLRNFNTQINSHKSLNIEP